MASSVVLVPEAELDLDQKCYVIEPEDGPNSLLFKLHGWAWPNPGHGPVVTLFIPYCFLKLALLR